MHTPILTYADMQMHVCAHVYACKHTQILLFEGMHKDDMTVWMENMLML